MQSDVAYRIVTMENITPNVLKQIEESLESSLRNVLGGDLDVGGPKVVADILNLTDREIQTLFREVEEVQLRIVQQVRQLEEQGQITIVRGDSDDQFV